MNGEEARQGLPDNNAITDAQNTAEHGVRLPCVRLTVTIEADPQLNVDAATPEDRLALIAWISECRPDIDQFLRGISREIHQKRKTA